MTKKIFRSIMLCAGVVLLASLIVIMGCLYDYFGGVQERQLRDELSFAAAGVDSEGADYLSRLDPRADFRVTWIDADGSVLFDTKADQTSMENHADREEFQEALRSGSGEGVRYSSTLFEKTVYCARRLPDGTVLRVSASRATAGMLAVGMLQPTAIVFFAAMLLSFLLAKRLSRRIVQPLNQLDLEHPLENDAYEELSPLLGRISRQSSQIDGQLRELRQKNDEFNQITDSMKEGLVLLNEKGLVLSINPAARRLFGAKPSCVGDDFLTVERSLGVSRAVQSAFSEGHGEARLERDGREYRLDVSRIESDGAAVGAVVLTFDVTEQTLAERTRREFTANVSHELKTPLQSIMGSAELIENGLVRPEDLPRFAGRIRTEAARLVSLIEDILRLSRLDEGESFPAEEVELLSLAQETVESLADLAREKQVTLRATGESAAVLGSRRLLSEVLYNLCENAVKYNRPGGSAEVRVESTDGRTILTVSDTGIGIPAEHQARVFERFYRVDKSRSRESGGTGLGLSIVKHAVQYMNGKLSLESEPGRGTTVRIEIASGAFSPRLKGFENKTGAAQ